jgi:macrolide-specific efflux system membrane fusion protein
MNKYMIDTTSRSPLAALVAFLLRNRLLVIILIVIAAGAYYFLIPTTSAQATSVPRLSPVTRGDIENTVTAAGKLTSKDWVDIGAQVSGQLETIHVEVGDIVKKGQLLAEIDATVQFASVAASRASLNALKSQQASRASNLNLAKLNAERQARMMKDRATSQQEYDNAQTALIEAQSSLLQLEAQIAQSEAGLKSQEAQLGYTKIYAPMDGTVVSIVAKEGQTINANQSAPTILTIADLTVMTVEAEVSEADIGKLKKNMLVYFSTLGGGERRWNSSVRQILPTPTTSNNVVLYTVLFDIDNADNALLSEMTAQVFFVTSSARNVLSVPVGALTYIDDAGANKTSTVAASAPSDRFANMTDEQRQERRAAAGATGQRGGGADGGGRRGGGAQRAVTPTVVDSSKPRRATVSRQIAEGEFETVEVQVGVASRIAAEIISGLNEGDQVVSGIIQQRTETSTQQAAGNTRIPRNF